MLPFLNLSILWKNPWSWANKLSPMRYGWRLGTFHAHMFVWKLFWMLYSISYLNILQWYTPRFMKITKFVPFRLSEAWLLKQCHFKGVYNGLFSIIFNIHMKELWACIMITIKPPNLQGIQAISQTMGRSFTTFYMTCLFPSLLISPAQDSSNNSYS